MQRDLVYVVDDDPSVLASIGLLLRSLRLDCRTFGSGDALLNAVSSLPPACVLTDLRMPGLSGLGLQAELLRRGFNWPVVFMTGHGEVPTAVEAIKNGAVEFIEKPFTDERLLTALHAGFRALKRVSEPSGSALAEVRTALRRNGIFPHYQPKVDLGSGKVVGFEALIRWGASQQGDNAKLIHQAFNDEGLSKPLSERMLDVVVSDVAGWLEGKVEFGHVAINASSADLEDPSFPSLVLGKLEKWNIPPSRIHIEVTESVSLGPDATEVKESLATLRNAGIMVALDDFGTGYASLTHLQDLPFDYIKIDRSFVARSEEPSSASIIRAMIGLSTGLGKGTVAEGVETAEQARFLQEQGCQIGQGHLFRRPVPADAVPDLCHSDALKRDL